MKRDGEIVPLLCHASRKTGENIRATGDVRRRIVGEHEWSPLLCSRFFQRDELVRVACDARRSFRRKNE